MKTWKARVDAGKAVPSDVDYIASEVSRLRRYTLQFMPQREDIASGLGQEGAEQKSALWHVFDAVQPGDVLVVQAFGDLYTGCLGEMLITYLKGRGSAGLVFEDSDAVFTGDALVTHDVYSGRRGPRLSARASNEDASRKLKLAGADRIVQPYQAAGRVMANLLLKPQVTAFVDVVTSAGGADLRFEEIEVTDASGQGGKTIRDLEIRKETGALIVALRKRDGTFDTTPTPEAAVEVGDVLIAAGTEEELRALEQLFAPRETLAR